MSSDVRLAKHNVKLAEGAQLDLAAAPTLSQTLCVMIAEAPSLTNQD